MEAFKNIVKILYQNPHLIFLTPFIFLLYTLVLCIFLLIPLTLLESPTLYLLVDVFGWYWTVDDYRWVMGSGLSFWIGVFWCSRKTRFSLSKEKKDRGSV